MQNYIFSAPARLFASVLLAAFLFSCSDSDSGSTPTPSSSSDLLSSSDGSQTAGSSSSIEPSSSSETDGNSTTSSSSSENVVSSSSFVSSSSTIPLSSESNAFGAFEDSTFTDPRDNKEYIYRIISPSAGKVLWMRDNLNYSRQNTIGYCYGINLTKDNIHRDSTSCDGGFGRFYSYEDAMDGMTGEGVQGLCPKGWHIPTRGEWSGMAPRVLLAGNNIDLSWGLKTSEGFYWTSSGIRYTAKQLDRSPFYQAVTQEVANAKFSVRCIANQSWDCGAKTYNPANEFCLTNEVYPRCEDKAYDVATKGCCGNQIYIKAEQICGEGGKLLEKCGGEDYDPATEGCKEGVILPKCGTADDADLYDPATEFCTGTTITQLCGGEQYNIATEGCEDDVILPKCGTAANAPLYNPATHFCTGTTVTKLCGGEEYNISTHGCEDDVILKKCGTAANAPLYNTETHFCTGTTVTQLCGGLPYDIVMQKCEDEVIINDYILYETWENGTNGWLGSSVNYKNRWTNGTEAGGAQQSARAAYISYNSEDYGWAMGTADKSVYYKSVTFPTQTADFTLKFDYKVSGENSTYDYMDVYLVPTGNSYSPAELDPSDRIGSTKYYSTSSWTAASSIPLAASKYSGKTYRLLFRWNNAGYVYTSNCGSICGDPVTEIGNRPAAIDNVLLK